MALEWGKQISFAGLKKAPGKQKQTYPEKRYINLVVVDKKTLDARRAIPTAIILIIVVALVVKFGIFDFYARVAAKQAELSTYTTQLSTIQAPLKDYNAVLEEYEGYESLSISSDGLVVPATDALALVDNHIAPYARVASVSLKGDTLALNLTDITLDGVGRLSSSLYQQGIVKSVSVSTAAARDAASDAVTAAMTITLASVEG